MANEFEQGIIDQLKQLIDAIETGNILHLDYSKKAHVLTLPKGKGYGHVFTGYETLTLSYRKVDAIDCGELQRKLRKLLE